MTPSKEQIKAIEATKSLAPGEIACGNAYAGTGKTTTAKMIAHAVAGEWKVIYICFNRDMSDEARKLFPSSVEVRTAHSLAYAGMGVGRTYAAKRDDNNPPKLATSVRPQDLLKHARMDIFTGRSVIQTITAFLSSDAATITSDHLPPGEPLGKRQQILSGAVAIWKRMADVNDPMPITHDGYLKLWVMQRPILPYDLIIVDEGQDLNPTLLDLVQLSVTAGKRVVFLGDTHQSIYGFRKAVDAMEFAASKAAQKFSLTESYRFAQPTASAASKLLTKFKGDPVALLGRGGPTPGNTTRCVISRTNAKLLNEAITHLRQGSKLHFAATSDRDNWNPHSPYRFQEILDVHSLSVGASARVQTPHLKSFSSYGEFIRFARGSEEEGRDADPELCPLADFVDSHGSAVPSLLKRLSDAATGPRNTNQHFTTAHRSKGKEWNSITLLDDFMPLDDSEKLAKRRDTLTVREFKEEINLLYVAITRARGPFMPPPSSARFFNPIG